MEEPVASRPAQLSDVELLKEVQRRAVRFFWEVADPKTGLINDRASNFTEDSSTVASIAATGYGLAALSIAAERGWVVRDEAVNRAKLTLRFLLEMPNEHGWMRHFVDKRTGERAWDSEFSSIDTALLLAGALVCGEYFAAELEIAQLVDQLYRRIDWWWMLTNSGTQPEKRVISHGWRPITGFIQYNYGSYSEAILLYLLGLGAPVGPLPAECWDAIDRPIFAYAGFESLRGGPIFIHQMPAGYFKLSDQRDRFGIDYWVSSANAMKIDRRFCADHAFERKTYTSGFWGLNASDGPDGYKAYGAYDSSEDGTVSPTGAISSISFDPGPAISVTRLMYDRLGETLWGKYGFANSFNLDRNWHSPDVIGIDLGMALLAIENHRTGLIWKLMNNLGLTARALAAAGFQKTPEVESRLVLRKSLG
jgi:hypothetical protein